MIQTTTCINTNQKSLLEAEGKAAIPDSPTSFPLASHTFPISNVAGCIPINLIFQKLAN